MTGEAPEETGAFPCPPPPSGVGFGMAIPMTPGLVAQLERTELKVWGSLYRNAPPAAVAACGIGSRDFGPATAMWMSKVDVLAVNRVVGLGLEGPPDPKVVAEIVDTYEQAMIPRFFVQLAPLVTLGPTIDAVAGAGFAKHNNWIRLVRDASPPGPAPTKLRVEEIDATQADTFRDAIAAGFGWTPELASPVAAMIGTPGWKFYLAFQGDRAVGTSVLVVDGTIGWLGFATVLPEARGHGGQSTMIARRILDAHHAGCEVLCVETAEEGPERPAPSYRNVLRTGFEVGYVRPNWIYQFQQRDSA